MKHPALNEGPLVIEPIMGDIVALYDRWENEKEYEDFSEYQKTMVDLVEASAKKVKVEVKEVEVVKDLADLMSLHFTIPNKASFALTDAGAELKFQAFLL